MNLSYFQDTYKHTVVPRLDKPYKLNLCHTRKYIKAKTRVLVVIEHVSSGDLSEGALLKDKITYETYSNVLSYMEQYARDFGASFKPEYAFVNFNDIKSYHLSPQLQSTATKMFAKRVKHWIKELEPTHILIFGSKAAKALISKKQFNEPDKYQLYRGWEFKINDIPTYFTIPIDDAFTAPQGKHELGDDAIVQANLLGYASQKLAMAFIPSKEKKKLTIDSSVEYKNIETIKAFDKFYKKLMKAQYVSYDIETTDLSTLSNTVLLTQFALDSEPDVAYVVPIYHKDSPFSKKKVKYIEEKLRAFFMRKCEWTGKYKTTKYLIGQNIGFDLRVTRHWLNVPYVYYPVWDIQAGEFLLDENKKGLASHIAGRGGYYGLASICCNYGCDFYLTAEFGKEDRDNIANTDLKKPLLMYGSADVIFPIRIHIIQQYLASKLPENNKKNYLNEYRRMVLVQQSQMIKVQSVMKQRGTYVNLPYLEHISSDNGPVEERLVELDQELLKDESVIKANSVLLKNENMPSQGLFGNVQQKMIIDLSKAKHKHVLFDEVLELEPLDYSRKTGAPKYDKFFLKHYKDTNECTGLMQRISQLSKIKSAFITPFIHKLEYDLDSKIDHRIRPNFGYIGVVTGRSNSSDPSLQQIPEHSDDAHIVKRMFGVPAGHLHGEADYSSHEVRVWGIVSDDPSLAKVFRTIHNYLVKMRLKPSKKLYDGRKQKADPHRLNYEMFTNKPAKDVSDTERQDAKGITFGCFTLDTICQTNNGSFTLRNLLVKDNLRVLDKSGDIKLTKNIKHQGTQVVYKLQTTRSILEGTAKHNILAISDGTIKMVELANLSNNDYVIQRLPVPGNRLLPTRSLDTRDNDCYILGIISKHCRLYNGDKLTLTIKNITVEDELLLRDLIGVFIADSIRTDKGVIRLTNLTAVNSILKFFKYRLDGLLGIPNIYACNTFFLKQFLKGYLKTDVYEVKYKNKHCLRLNNVDMDYQGLAYILLTLKITDFKIVDSLKSILVYGESAGILANIIGFRLTGDHVNNSNYSIVRFFNDFALKCKKYDVNIPYFVNFHRQNTDISLLPSSLKDTYNQLKELGDLSKITISKVIKRDYVGRREVYDVMDVQDTHTWIANSCVVSNSMYGMSANSLAGTIKKTLEETIDIMNRFFNRFSKAKEWLTNMVKSAHGGYFVQSAIGRRRNLYCMMSGHKSIASAGERRAQNSTIQGLASDLGFLASDLYSKAKYECHDKLGLVPERVELPYGSNCSIHDSIKTEDTFDTFFLGVHLLEWSMTNGVKDFLKEVYGFKINVCFEVEFAVSGVSWADKRTWVGPFEKPDYETGEEQDNCSLETCVKQALRDHEKTYPGTVKDVDKTYRQMLKSYERQKKILNLDKNYPLNTHKENI